MIYWLILRQLYYVGKLSNVYYIVKKLDKNR